MTDNAMTKKKG